MVLGGFPPPYVCVLPLSAIVATCVIAKQPLIHPMQSQQMSRQGHRRLEAIIHMSFAGSTAKEVLSPRLPNGQESLQISVLSRD